MEKKRSRWLTGCGIGCGILLLILILLAVAGTLFVRDTMKGFDGALGTREQLDERFGDTDAFTPSPDGSIPAERIEIFLRVREHLAQHRKEVGGFFSSMNMSDEQVQELEEATFWEKLSFTGRISKQAMGFPGVMGRFFEARNQALLDENMGSGEYTYIYVLAYYSWLGHSPADDLDSVSIGVVADGAEAVDSPAPPPPPGLPGASGRLPRRVHRDLIGILRNQRRTLLNESATETDPSFAERLDSEIAAMETDRNKLPWSDGLPGAIAASLEPYRERLEATYDPRANSFELLRNRKDGMSIHAE